MLEKINGTINYPFFRIYSEAIVGWIKQFNPLNRKNAEPQPLRVIYGNPERIFSDQNLIPDNERIDVPAVGIYLTGIAPQPTWNIPFNIKFNKKYRMPNGFINDLYSYEFSKLKTYSIKYNVDILAEFKSDADYILFSILRELTNNEIRYLQIYGSGGMQWIPVKLINTTEQSTLEPGDAKDLQIRWVLDFEISNAYLPVSATSELMWDGIVADYNVQIETESKKSNGISANDEVNVAI